jgi:hypothetical protein
MLAVVLNFDSSSAGMMIMMIPGLMIRQTPCWLSSALPLGAIWYAGLALLDITASKTCTGSSWSGLNGVNTHEQSDSTCLQV